ncbi:MAG: c-type cytochrome [Gammaproteobacteria bacterium]|nr:c-type cytochrome [Gammaproteobacteria bacterium]MDH3428473.1 c-type cytochrome [Gammaproteobacteria bacterium]MDH3432834.1 c-type cytochrome [Gammaproteobacteria bacterium]
MRINRICFVSVLLPFFAAVSSASELDAVVENCNGCHGTDGVSQWSDVPTIAGMPEYVHSDALYFYRDNERPCGDSEYRQGDTSRPATNMCSVAGDMSDDMIDEVAAYYAELPFVAAQQEFDASLAATGKAVHDEKCDMCHSDGGSNPDDEAGILAGQWMGYLEVSFAQYATDDREQPKSMKEMIDTLSEADVTALVHYYASQQ